MHIYTIIQNQIGTYSLQKDNVSCLCPKSMVVLPITNMAGQGLQPTQMACSTICPFANLQARPIKQEQEVEILEGEEPKQLFYVIDCEGRTKEFELSETIEAKPQHSKLIKV